MQCTNMYFNRIGEERRGEERRGGQGRAGLIGTEQRIVQHSIP